MGKNQFTDREGINLVNTVFTSIFKWYFREQQISDIGIDALVEPAIGHKSESFCLAGLQIKTGAGNFSKVSAGYNYYATPRHYKYWTESNVPVFLIGAFPDDKKVYWEILHKDKFIPLEKSFKILLPFENELNEGSINEIYYLIKEYFEEYYEKTYPSRLSNGEISPLEYHTLIREAFNEVAVSARRMGVTMNETSIVIERIRDLVREYNRDDINYESPRGKRLIRSLAKEITKFRLLIKTEYEFLNDSFEEAIQLFLEYTTLFIAFHDKEGRDRRELTRPHINDLLNLIKEGKVIQESILSGFEHLQGIKISPDIRKGRSAVVKFLKRNMKVYDGYEKRVKEFKGKRPSKSILSTPLPVQTFA